MATRHSPEPEHSHKHAREEAHEHEPIAQQEVAPEPQAGGPTQGADIGSGSVVGDVPPDAGMKTVVLEQRTRARALGGP
jgi:hypothetical protein